MRRIVFRLGLFESEADRAYSERALKLLAHALVAANVAYLRAHPRTPALYEAGVRLDTSRSRCPRSEDEWQGIASILESGAANNVSLACWRCAERIVGGEAVEPALCWAPGGGGLYHVSLSTRDGTVEDPSAIVFARAAGAPMSPVVGRPDLHTSASRIALELQIFRREAARSYSERVLSILLGALTAANVLYLRAYPSAPSLYRAGVRYRAERFPREEWRGIAALHEEREGDCEDLACARSAELIARGGRAARPVFRWRRLGRLSVYHILVRHSDGSIEDPSLLLGMGARGATLADLGMEGARSRARGARPRAQGERTSWERC